MKYFFNPTTWILTLLLGIALPQGLVAKSAGPTVLPSPGDVLKGSGYLKVVLEGDRVLVWPSQGALTLQDSSGLTLAQVNLSARPKKQQGAEALDLEVEETDLGGARGAKRYLQGKKKPKGRSFDSENLKGTPDEKEQVKKGKKVIGGVTLTELLFPNGARGLEIAWPEAKEKIFFDRRNTLVSVKQTRRVGPLTYTLTQWSDGSFKRSYRGPGGGFDYTYDILEGSYRLLFTNPQGEILSEIFCDRSCEVEG